MEKLFKVARGEVECEDERLRVYKDLVFNRFYDCLETSFPLFTSFIGSGTLAELVGEFLKEPHRSPFLIDVAENFVYFLLRKKPDLSREKPFLIELLRYEWLRIELYNAPDPMYSGSFSFQSHLSLSPSARLVRFIYPVHRLTDSHRGKNPPKGRYNLLMFRTPEEFTIKDIELTDFVYEFLYKVLVKGCIPEKVLESVEKDIEPSEVASYLERFLKDLWKLGAVVVRS